MYFSMNKYLLLYVSLINFEYSFLKVSCQEVSKPSPLFGPLELPKALHWDAEAKALYFVDVYQSTVHKYIPENGTLMSTIVGTEPVAFVIPIQNTVDKFILSYGPNISVITWDGKSKMVKKLKNLIHIDKGTYRANEGKVAPSGTLFVGTHSHFLPDGSIQPKQAGIYGFKKDGTIAKLLDNTTVSNTMQWSADFKKFYFIDSLQYTVESFSYDIKTDALNDRKLIYNFKDAGIPGVPDGMIIDNEGMIWVTAFNGYQILRLNPNTNQVLEKIELDAYEVTSVAFVGPKLNDFYITTGRYNLTKEILKKYPNSGMIFRATNFKVSGHPGIPFNINKNLL